MARPVGTGMIGQEPHARGSGRVSRVGVSVLVAVKIGETVTEAVRVKVGASVGTIGVATVVKVGASVLTTGAELQAARMDKLIEKTIKDNFFIDG